MEEYSKDADYCRYLALILSSPQEVKTAVRQVAGLTLKSQVEKNFAYLNMPVIDYIK
jgi:hypothetical protein